jgi:hypothetical protein
MSRMSKDGRRTGPALPPPARRGLARLVAVLLLILILVCVAAWWLSQKSGETPLPSGASVLGTAATSSPVSTRPAVEAVARTPFAILKGRWLRPDGGYVIDVRSVDGTGRMDASYFNPRSIHVAQARASQDGAATKVFIELRDVNYPGSTYNLVYDPQDDRLKGIYYQAMLQESYEVFFIRTK